ncbi:unnamed protein product [Plutella xylostella]|uniref:(diamondback moth) hypothetical protein n=1 Tax=Plutella xylostella TaxID=51655 RepID=A0A8S4FET9_PLUXY|nr:unnamed protein product [Plutella xylostella]
MKQQQRMGAPGGPGPQAPGYRYCSVAELVCVAAHADSITDAARCACELGCEHTVYEVEKLTEIDPYPTGGYRYCSVAELVCVAAHADSITDAARCACELGCEHTVYEVEKLTEIDPYPTDGYRYCSVAELVCVAAHADSITDAARCACELGCEHTVYEVEKLTEIDSGKGQVSSSLETEFVSWPMVRYKREVLFGWVDLLVSFGGIAGLFLGFSLLSGVEVLYYFTLRACCSMARDRHALRREREERLAKPRPAYDLSLVPWWKQPPQKRAPSPAPGPLLVKERTRTQHSQPPQYSPPPGYTTFLP